MRLLGWILVVLAVSCSRPPTAGEEQSGEASAPVPEETAMESVAGVPGVSFEVALTGESYRMGEAMSLELRFSSTRPHTHELDAATYDRGGRLHIDTYHVTPSGGWRDPLAHYMASGLGEMGGLRATPVLGEEPYVITRDLAEYVHFSQPGTYTLVVDSARISSQGEDGEVQWNQVVRAEPVTLRVVEPEPEWQAETLAAALEILDDPKQPEEARVKAARSLRFLGTEAAARAMVERLGEDRFLHELMFGLLGTPHRRVAIDALEARVTAPDAGVSGTLLSTLARLEVWEASTEGPLGPYPHDGSAGAQSAWQKRSRAEQTALQEATVKHAERALAALKSKTAAARAETVTTLFELVQRWSSMEKGPDVSSFAGLGEAVQGSFGALTPELQRRMLQHQWRDLPRAGWDESLLAVYRDAKASDDLRSLALQRYAEVEPEAGRALILEEIREPRVIRRLIQRDVLMSLDDAEIPELDAPLLARLQAREGYEARILVAELIARYSSGDIAGPVEVYLEAMVDPAIEVEAPLLAYLLRVSPERAVALLEARLGPDATLRRHELLLKVAERYPDPGLEALAVEQLEHAHPRFVIGAARALALAGTSVGKEALWQRFDAWHEVWKDRAEELGPQVIGEHPHGVEIELERALWQSLAWAEGWVLTEEEGERLLELCVGASECGQAGHAARRWYAGPVGLTVHVQGSGEVKMSLGHPHEYGTLDALGEKLSQLRPETRIALTVWGATPKEEASLRADVKRLADAHGLVLP